MKAKIQETIDKNEQVILLLNKRGYSNYVRCLDCDEVLKCPHCDVLSFLRPYQSIQFVVKVFD